MHELTKAQTLQFIAENADLIDSDAGRINPFSTSAWLAHFVEHVLEADSSVPVLRDRSDGESLMLLHRNARSSLDLTGLSNYYCSLYSPVLTSAIDRPAALRRLVRQIADGGPNCTTITLSPLDADCSDTASLEQALRADRWYVRRYFCFGNWYLPCESLSFKDYMASRDSKLLNTWNRKSKKFLASPGNRLRIVRAPAEVEQAMDQYEQVYGKSWKQAEPYPHFVRGWARACAERGWLRLGIAQVDDVPIAAQFWFTINRRAYIFKLAYDEAYSAWSAGTLLSARMFEESLDADRVVEIDYLTGDDTYKRSWVTHRRERVGIVAHNLRSVRGIARALKEAAAEWRQRFASGRPGDASGPAGGGRRYDAAT